jgi:hypothetical protein
MYNILLNQQKLIFFAGKITYSNGKYPTSVFRVKKECKVSFIKYLVNFFRASDRGRIGVFLAFKTLKTHWRLCRGLKIRFYKKKEYPLICTCTIGLFAGLHILVVGIRVHQILGCKVYFLESFLHLFHLVIYGDHKTACN